MRKEDLERLRRLADQGWHAAEAYVRGDGQMAMSVPTGHPLAPALTRLLAERDGLLGAVRELLGSDRLDRDEEDYTACRNAERALELAES